MTQKFTRRQFLQLLGSATGLTLAGISLPVIIGERKAIFPPNDSYWAKEKPSDSPALQSDLQVDFAIIGGGYTGLSSAYHLAKQFPNKKIVLLEAKQVGEGASGRHGGMVLPQIEAESFEIGDSLEAHKQMYDITAQGMKDLQAVVEESGLECDLRLDGYALTFVNEEDGEYYRDYVAEVNEIGMHLEYWSADKTAEMLGTDVFAGAVFDPNGGSVHAMKLVKALKQAVEGLGIQIFGNSPVTKIVEGAEILLSVGESAHQVTAKNIVLATNAYTSKLGYFKNQVVPIHVQTAVTPPLTASQLESLERTSDIPYYDDRSVLYHLVFTPDQRIVIGGGSAEYCWRNDLEYCGDLSKISTLMLNELKRIYPSLADVQFEDTWDGVIGITMDGMPTVGVMGDHKNIYYGLAYNGQGVTLSFVFGQVIAALANDKNHAWLDTPYAHNTLPFMPGEPYRWIGATAMTGYYAWQDRK